MTDGPIMDAVSEIFEADPFNPEFVPEDGWAPEDYPQITVAPIPYTSSSYQRADPYITITTTGWLFLEVGNIRIAIPDEEEWEKFTHMVECMWNTWRRTHPAVPEEEYERNTKSWPDSDPELRKAQEQANSFAFREFEVPGESCVCGSPDTPGVIHRADGPCYHPPEQNAPVPSFEEFTVEDTAPTSTPPPGVDDEGETHDPA